jgi:hypothetical protein
MFKRLIHYAEKYYHFSAIAESMEDSRINPSIPAVAIFKLTAFLFMLRMSSLNSMDEFRKEDVQKIRMQKLIDSKYPSADSIAYSLERFDLIKLRKAIHRIYALQQRRHIVKKERVGEFLILSIDGHELFSSKKRCCEKCLQRKISKDDDSSIEYYHRVVVAQLVGGKMCNPLDMEPILPGEDEVNAAMRLFERIMRDYPKAFNVVTVDGLYLRSSFIKMLRSHGKDVVCVIKDKRRELMADALGIFNSQEPQIKKEGSDYYERWDEENFTSWDSLGFSIRVVRSKEKVCGKGKIYSSDWLWATTLSKAKANTETICFMGHHRWDIENQGFNEAVNYYHINHCFVHHPQAIQAILLIFFIIYILHNAFYHLNLKKPLRQRHTFKHFVILFTSEFVLLLTNPTRAP